MRKVSLFFVAFIVMVSCTKEGVKEEAATVETDQVAAKKEVNGGRPLSAMLSGNQEVPGPGDPDGTGQVQLALNHGQRTISFSLSVSDIDPATAAHIHRAPAGSAGPVVVGLTAPTSGSSSGTISNVDRDLIKDIMKNPENYYVNVHNAAYPPGAVRGQLGK